MKSAKSPVEARRGRVLVIDDEPSVARALGRILHHDHDVEVALDGTEALARLRVAAYDVIFCDLRMPIMSGTEVHRAVALESQDQARRMVFMTGGAISDEIGAFLRTVGNKHISKPFDSSLVRSIANDFAS